MDAGFVNDLPALRGVQAGREYFVTMCPLKFVAKLLNVSDNYRIKEHIFGSKQL